MKRTYNKLLLIGLLSLFYGLLIILELEFAGMCFLAGLLIGRDLWDFEGL